MIRFARLTRTLGALLVGAALILPALQITHLAAPQAAHAAADLSASPLRGHWKNVDPHTRNIPYLRIGYFSGTLRLDIWGACHPTNCYWGESTLHASLTNGGTIYHFSFADKIVKLYVSNGVLQVHTYTHFTDGSGRADYDSYDTFNLSTPSQWQN